MLFLFFFFQAEDGIRDYKVTGVQTCALPISQAAETLCLDPRTLEALEAEDFAALGADVYVRGHLRRYAELIGESPAQLQELYARSARAAHPDLTRIPHREPGRDAARLVMRSFQVLP